MIEVTRPFLPPLEEYQRYIAEIWERNWLTNDGPLVQEFQKKIATNLNLNQFLFLSNGTVALQIAIKALGLKGEIITTPFSYVATTSSIVWENCEPVFVDIDVDSFNIDAKKIEAAITSKTTGILATHVYGTPCEVEEIDAIAKRHNLKVIYDAAHCYGTQYDGKSVLEYGDISTISFHATKLMHTVEGGGVYASDPELMKRMAYLRNFGHDGPGIFSGVGINGKNSEIHAAMGLVNLKYSDKILVKRKLDYNLYTQELAPLNLKYPKPPIKASSNYSYYPVVFESEKRCVKVFEYLLERQVYARRYFYPVLSQLDYVKQQSTPIAESIASRILCLPLFYQLEESEIHFVCNSIKECLVDATILQKR
jgi:dTDP-4-amino-4,6-dideoxygalactose transaminase